MKRKRFIKLLMAAGYSRNRAEREAIDVTTAGKSYMMGIAFIMFEAKLRIELLRMWELPRATSLYIQPPYPAKCLEFKLFYNEDEMYRYMRDQDGEETQNEQKALC